MNTVSNTEFENLMKDLRVERFSSNEILLSNDLNDDFYFYYNTDNHSITDSGQIELTGEQYENICKAASEYLKENPTDENEYYAFSHIKDHYREYGVNRNMFI